MARFLGTVNTRLGSVDSGFTKAAVFTSPGTTSFTIPGSATKAKVIVVGAGSNYRVGSYFAQSTCCFSGVSFPRQCYCFRFNGHLTGAGGGYAEKLYTSGVGGTTLAVQVASPSLDNITANIVSGSNVITGVSGIYSYAIAANSTIAATGIPGGTTILSTTNVTNSVSGNVTSGSSTLSINNGASFMSNIHVGAKISGPGILLSGNTCITGVNTGACTVTLSQPSPINNLNGAYTISSVTLNLSNAASASNATASANITGIGYTTVSGSGLATVSASSGTDFVLQRTCQNATTPLDNTLWNPINVGFELPVCGYQICYDGHYNIGGTGSGGDVNRTGGVGVLMPDFTVDSLFDGALAAGGGAGTYTCIGYTYNPQINCACYMSYHNVFGVQCGQFPNGCCGYQCTCACYYMCSGSIAPNCSLVTQGVSGDLQFKFKSTNSTKTNLLTSASITNQLTNKLYAKDMPYGFGGQSGTAIGDGARGTSFHLVQGHTGPAGGASTLPAGGGTCQFTYSAYTSGYDYSFGGTQYLCGCMNISGGCASARPSVCGFCACSGVWNTEYVCIGNTGFNNVFGSQSSGMLCYGLPRYCPTGGGGGAPQINEVTLSYDIESPNAATGRTGVLDLNIFTDSNGNPVQSLEYSRGASLERPAPGGGGNSVWPAGGSGAVIILY